MSNGPSHEGPTGSLKSRIRQAEQLLEDRRRRVAHRADRLRDKLRDRLTAPASLLCAAGSGFLLGAATRPCIVRPNQSAETQHPGKLVTSPWWATTIQLLSTAHALYAALPLTRLMRFFERSGPSAVKPQGDVNDQSKSCKPKTTPVA